MLPHHLRAEEFERYSPEAKRVAACHLGLLRELPLAFAALLLQQIQEYDWRFPAERDEIDKQISFLEALPEPERRELLSGLAEIRLSKHLEALDWVNSPARFSEELSAYLWATHQIDAFHQAATSFMEKFHAAAPPEAPRMPRLGIAVIGKGVEQNTYPLFRKLKAHGTYFTNLNPAQGLRTLLDAAAVRAQAHPVPYGHWYIDGGAEEHIAVLGLTSVSYQALQPVRTALLKKIDGAIHTGIGGPEALRTMLQGMQPGEIGLGEASPNAVLDHFLSSVLTQGSGTQIYSTTFVQWVSRELWRRAQPVTLVARFAPRQKQRPMNELLSGKDAEESPDVMGSLIDADMGAYYIWIGQQRLTGAREAAFLAWFENHNQALVISSNLPRNTTSNSPVDMRWLLHQIGIGLA